MKNDTLEQLRVEPGKCRLPGLWALLRGPEGDWRGRRPGAPGTRWTLPAGRAGIGCRRDPRPRRGQGQLAHTPPSRPAPSLSFPAGRLPAGSPGSCVPALGGEAERTLGRGRAGAKALFSRCTWEGGPPAGQA
ncbi:unnamed protein product [Rangifer tarandus platyrhynchus]|uniref:Uncharacterized protein n=1 Tax=Rangifer tarandus platyrhynchus TaxID=3082113 RepID=A0AC60A8C1_RANTA